MENMSHQWASFHSYHFLLPSTHPSFSYTPTPSISLSASFEKRPNSGLMTHVSPSSPQLPCPYALTQAGRGSLVCTLHLHVALPAQNNRPSNLMRLRYGETLRACHDCVCLRCRVGAMSAFLLPKTNILCADPRLYLCYQLVRPVTVVPSVPGIPGPPSPQPQPAQTEATLVFIVDSLIYLKYHFTCCICYFPSERDDNKQNDELA